MVDMIYTFFLNSIPIIINGFQEFFLYLISFIMTVLAIYFIKKFVRYKV